MSYAAVLHRLALGEEVPGAELLALPGYVGDEDLVFAAVDYDISLVPGVLVRGATLAAASGLLMPGDDPLLCVALINHELATKGWPPHKPLPPEVEAALTSIGLAADVTLKAGEPSHGQNPVRR